MENQAVYSKAIELLHRASTPLGFVASVNEHDNYKRIWTRDGVVNGLASLLSNDEQLIETFRNTLVTIFENQHTSGFMPSNVSPDRSVSYGGLVGRADNPSWAVIGLCQYAIQIDQDLAARFQKQVEKCFALMDCWEYNARHLLYVPQSGDWADEYIQHGYVLFDQLLRVWALTLAAKVFHRDEWRMKADQITALIHANYWNHQEDEVELYAMNMRRQMLSAPRTFWLMGFNPSQVYHQFDLQANSLALLLSLGDARREATLVEYIQSRMKSSTVLPSLSPAIGEQDISRFELVNNYAYSFRNHPHEFHNGGVWPVWNGLMVAALQSVKQTSLAARLAQGMDVLVGQSDYQFNECYHGENLKPIGVPSCVWSAGGVIIAHASLKGKQLQF